MVTPVLRQQGRHGYDSGNDQEPGRARVGGGEPKATILVSQGTYNQQEMARWGATIGLAVIAHWARRPELLPRPINIVAKALELS